MLYLAQTSTERIQCAVRAYLARKRLAYLKEQYRRDHFLYGHFFDRSDEITNWAAFGLTLTAVAAAACPPPPVEPPKIWGGIEVAGAGVGIGGAGAGRVSLEEEEQEEEAIRDKVGSWCRNQHRFGQLCQVGPKEWQRYQSGCSAALATVAIAATGCDGNLAPISTKDCRGGNRSIHGEGSTRGSTSPTPVRGRVGRVGGVGGVGDVRGHNGGRTPSSKGIGVGREYSDTEYPAAAVLQIIGQSVQLPPHCLKPGECGLVQIIPQTPFSIDYVANPFNAHSGGVAGKRQYDEPIELTTLDVLTRSRDSTPATASGRSSPSPTLTDHHPPPTDSSDPNAIPFNATTATPWAQYTKAGEGEGRHHPLTEVFPSLGRLLAEDAMVSRMVVKHHLGGDRECNSSSSSSSSSTSSTTSNKKSYDPLSFNNLTMCWKDGRESNTYGTSRSRSITTTASFATLHPLSVTTIATVGMLERREDIHPIQPRQPTQTVQTVQAIHDEGAIEGLGDVLYDAQWEADLLHGWTRYIQERDAGYCSDPLWNGVGKEEGRVGGKDKAEGRDGYKAVDLDVDVDVDRNLPPLYAPPVYCRLAERFH